MQVTFYSVILLTLFVLVGCTDSSPLVLDATRSESSKHLGKGVWLKIPSSFEKANSYDGYQMWDNSGSISVDIINRKLDDVKGAYDPDALSHGKLEMLEMRPVIFGDNEFAFYSKVRDKRKKTIKYLLAIANGAETYRIKAFCFEEMEPSIGKKIEKAMFTTHIGEKVEEVPDFIVAKIITLSHMVLTRDGKHPTESKDEAVIEEISFDNESKFTRSMGKEYLKNEFSKIITKGHLDITTQGLENAFFQYGGGEFDGKNIFVSLVVSGDYQVIFTKCTANTKIGRTYFENFIKQKYIKSTVAER